MSINDVTPGKTVPEEFNVIIEIPMNADPIKYEVDKESGAIFVDRFMGDVYDSFHSMALLVLKQNALSEREGNNFARRRPVKSGPPTLGQVHPPTIL